MTLGGPVFDYRDASQLASFSVIKYNLARPLKTLRVELFDDPNRRWKPRTPAMAAGLTGHIWTVKELLTTVVPPNNT